jgi:hypothetical protein
MAWLYSKFCEMPFLCYQGEPHGLGWFILVSMMMAAALMLLMAVFLARWLYQKGVDNCVDKKI